MMYDSACIESKFVCNLPDSLNIKIRQLGLALIPLSFRARTCGNDCRPRLSHSFLKKNVGKSTETEASYYYHSPEHHLGEKIRSNRKEREFWHLCESKKKVLLKIQPWKNDMGEKKSMEFDDCLLDF